MCVCVSMCMPVCVNVYACMCVNLCMYVFKHVDISLPVCVYACLCVCVWWGGYRESRMSCVLVPLLYGRSREHDGQEPDKTVMAFSLEFSGALSLAVCVCVFGFYISDIWAVTASSSG